VLTTVAYDNEWASLISCRIRIVQHHELTWCKLLFLDSMVIQLFSEVLSHSRVARRHWPLVGSECTVRCVVWLSSPRSKVCLLDLNLRDCNCLAAILRHPELDSMLYCHYMIAPAWSELMILGCLKYLEGLWIRKSWLNIAVRGNSLLHLQSSHLQMEIFREIGLISED
jgi:hypothetical protein